MNEQWMEKARIFVEENATDELLAAIQKHPQEEALYMEIALAGMNTEGNLLEMNLEDTSETDRMIYLQETIPQYVEEAMMQAFLNKAQEMFAGRAVGMV